MRIDSHMHVNFKKLDVNRLISYMDVEGIDKCWLLTWEDFNPAYIDYMNLSVNEIFDAYKLHPSRIIPMYAPDPSSPDAAGRFMKWYRRGIRGCGELKVSLGWDSPSLDPLLACLNRLGLPLVFHMEEGGYRFKPTTSSRFELLLARMLNTPRYHSLPRRVIDAVARRVGPLEKLKEGMLYYFPGYLADFGALEKRLIQFPNIKFVGHGPMFWGGFALQKCRGSSAGEGVTCRLLAEYDNLYADLSAYSGYKALVRDPAFTRSFLSAHSGKFLYGTDNFFIGLSRFLDSLDLPREASERICGRNAAELVECGKPATAFSVVSWQEA